jgi:hypothetical protein
MRLHDTFTRSYQELPPPPGPGRMYFCGPTVYQRIHIGNARPFVLSMWVAGPFLSSLATRAVPACFLSQGRSRARTRVAGACTGARANPSRDFRRRCRTFPAMSRGLENRYGRFRPTRVQIPPPPPTEAKSPLISRRIGAGAGSARARFSPRCQSLRIGVNRR